MKLLHYTPETMLILTLLELGCAVLMSFLCRIYMTQISLSQFPYIWDTSFVRVVSIKILLRSY